MKSGPHEEGLFSIARGLCGEHQGDLYAIKDALRSRGVDGQAIRRAMHQMRAEGHIAPAAPAEPSAQQRYIRDARASVMHLIDLKRAGHRARFTELRIPPESDVLSIGLHTRRFRDVGSFCSSPAALCAELGK